MRRQKKAARDERALKAIRAVRVKNAVRARRALRAAGTSAAAVLLAAGLTISAVVPVSAAAPVSAALPVVSSVTLDWDDLTDAQQEQAYLQLESENQALREQLAQLQGGSAGTAAGAGSGSSGTDGSGSGSTDASQADTTGGSGQAGAATDASEAAAQAQSAQIKSTDAFLADIAASFNARQETARTHTNEEVNAMSEADMWNFRFTCANVEQPFYDNYHSAQFDDLNVLYLCSEYCLGLEKQFQAEKIWNEQQDSEEANRLYTAGYYNRAYALVELCEFYGLDLADEYQNLKNAVSRMDAMSSEETRNASVDPAKVTQVQELLNSLGFLCGTPDGIAGRQTASCIERFQTMYGYDPADGIIDDELIAQMQDQLSRRQG